MPTATVEDYLKALLQLAEPGRGVGTSELAARLKVRAASVTHMLQRLSQRRLVRYRRYQGASLTAAGRRAATSVLRRHRLLEVFLHRVCRFPLHQVHREADALEHAASDSLADALDRLLDFPRRDPHGDPIPDRHGRLREDVSRPLADLLPGARAVVSRLEDSRPEALQHLTGLGLAPGRRVTLLRRLQFDGSAELRVGRRRVLLSPELARAVRVLPAPPAAPGARAGRPPRRTFRPAGRAPRARP
ncbi:MAG TPA: metal-dependent transcriptional regulator [Candidatus Saccharimonadales bacterium]|nr:metal-dependent transcriptional regulator [Candidatus Saccharimonadales bacterium]